MTVLVFVRGIPLCAEDEPRSPDFDLNCAVQKEDVLDSVVIVPNGGN